MTVVTVVNYMKRSLSLVCFLYFPRTWLQNIERYCFIVKSSSRGKFLYRVYELRHKIAIFIEEEQDHLHRMFWLMISCLIFFKFSCFEFEHRVSKASRKYLECTCDIVLIYMIFCWVSFRG